MHARDDLELDCFLKLVTGAVFSRNGCRYVAQIPGQIDVDGILGQWIQRISFAVDGYFGKSNGGSVHDFEAEDHVILQRIAIFQALSIGGQREGGRIGNLDGDSLRNIPGPINGPDEERVILARLDSPYHCCLNSPIHLDDVADLLSIAPARNLHF